MKRLFLTILFVLMVMPTGFTQNKPTDYHWVNIFNDEYASVSIALKTITYDTEPNPNISCVNHRFVSVWQNYLIKGYGSNPSVNLLSFNVYDLDCKQSKIVKAISLDENYNLIKESDSGVGYMPIKPHTYGDEVLNALLYYCRDYKHQQKSKDM